MRKVILFASGLLILTAVACNQSAKESSAEEITTDIINNPASASDDAVDTENLPAFDFEEEVMDFGEIAQGEKVKRVFRFMNSGKSDLIISDAKGSCGCTVPVWPKNPIAPGEKGEIEVVFDSNGKQGRQHKTITLVANTIPNTKVIAIKGDIKTPENSTNAK
ncbi:MAG: DUF1573 domain-containing protein [Bacteroidetes bacterium]|nr:MAG: DUF1573 domain-containing protein [Bacteroidota bacterium]MBL1144382.1 DUF1573 domain-containing protein [Bacteroidota bacterium]NOG57178.1 DUF1573 domain-containing protein [Bacteroidota bacterium]